MYSKAYLDSIHGRLLSSDISVQPEFDDIIEKLHEKLDNGDPLILSEEDFICNFLEKLSYSPDGSNPDAFDIKNCGGCQNYYFRNIYLPYNNNLEGHNMSRNAFGEIPRVQKLKDVAYLNFEYLRILNIVNGPKPTDILIDYLVIEIKHQLKAIRKYCKKTNLGYFRQLYEEKSIILHSWFAYLLSKEFFENLGSNKIILTFSGNTILIDGFCYIHILSRHFAGHIKGFQTKSYHLDIKNIKYKEIPSFLEMVVNTFFNSAAAGYFNGQSISLIFENVYYVLYFRPILSLGATAPVLRLQTFFPVVDQLGIQKLDILNKISISSSLVFLV